MRKSDSGIIGSAKRDSTQTKAASATPASTKPPTTRRAAEAALRPLHERPDERTDGDRSQHGSIHVEVAMAQLSTALVPRDERRTTVTTASGMFRRKITRQDTASTIAPPTTGPAAVAMLVQAVHAPIARPASSLYVARSSARLPGVSSAPKIPWIARAAISTSLVGRDAGEHGCSRKAGHADDERVRVAVAVAERARRQIERRQRERVAEEDPLLARQPEPELLVDRRQRDVDDEGVEKRHRRPEDRRHEHEALPRVVRHASPNPTTRRFRGSQADGWKAAAIDDIPPVKPDWPATWKSMRHHFGITAFGVNAVTKDAGNVLIPEHEHGGSGEQELYVIQRGAALATLDGEEVDVPAGSAVAVEGPVRAQVRGDGVADDPHRRRRHARQGVRGRRLGEARYARTRARRNLADSRPNGPVLAESFEFRHASARVAT